MDHERALLLHRVAVMVEEGGFSARQKVQVLVGTDVADAIYITHLRTLVRTEEQFEANPDIREAVNRLLEKEDILL